jgi:glycosyltransferase involved in cell wall biosynthesis
VPLSVIIPNLNMSRFLPDAIRSVQRQDVPVEEIIVVDNQSTDDSRDVIDRLRGSDNRIRIIEVTPEGPSKASNAGIAAARGDLIALLHADDVWPAGKLRYQMDRFARAPKVDIVAGFVTFFETLDRERLEPAAGSRVETEFVIHAGTWVWRRSVFDVVGTFDETMRTGGEDCDLFLRALEAQVPMTILTAPMLYYRRHSGSMTMAHKERLKTDFARVFAKSLARRRRNGTVGELPSFESFYERAMEIRLD